MAKMQKSLATLVLLLCLVAQVRATEMWRNLEDLNGFDGYIASNTPNSFTDNEMLLVSYYDASRWSFIRFNVSTLPESTQVQSVKLWIWTEYPGLNTPSRAMYMYPLFVPFSSSTTWNNKNISVYAGAIDVVAGSINNWTIVDITQYYQKWRSGQWVNNGIVFIPNQTQGVLNWFASANYTTTAAKKPRLQVTYTGSVTPPSNQFLSFPLVCGAPLFNSVCSVPYSNGAYTPGRINSVVDHSMNAVYLDLDGKVLAFTGETFQSTSAYPIARTACYPKQGNGVWSATLKSLYKGTNAGNCLVNVALNYEAHPGYDYVASSGTVVKAAAAGKVVNNLVATTGQSNKLCVPKGLNSTTYKGCAQWGAVGIDHGNGYITQYLHLSRIDVTAGQTIAEGQQIGLSGTTAAPNSPHLHFEVMKLRPNNINDYQPGSYAVVDPYGYDTSMGVPDYLAGITGVVNVKLWK